MENWIDFSSVPKYIGTGSRGKEVNDWKNAYGSKCKFYYNGISGEITLGEYFKDTHKIETFYKERSYVTTTSSLLKNNIGRIIGVINKDFKIDIGARLVSDNRDLTITDRVKYTDDGGVHRKRYRYHCNICGWDDGWIDECHLLKDVGCSCCHKATIVPGINDVATTDPWMIEYFVNKDDVTKTTTCSKRQFLMKCPTCGEEKMWSTEQLSTCGFACKRCSDGVSYGEKYFYSLLKQLGVNFKAQLSKTTFIWCDKYRYDFYLPDYNMIVEIHGVQHYERENNQYGYHPEIDEFKESLAKENGISYYIVLDCRKSESEYFKKSILSSELPQILKEDFNKVDWEECQRFTLRSFVYDICKYKNEHPELSTQDLSLIFPFLRTTIQSYLQRGSELGICIYNLYIEKHFKTKEKRLREYKKLGLVKENYLCA